MKRVKVEFSILKLRKVPEGLVEVVKTKELAETKFGGKNEALFPFHDFRLTQKTILASITILLRLVTRYIYRLPKEVFTKIGIA